MIHGHAVHMNERYLLKYFQQLCYDVVSMVNENYQSIHKPGGIFMRNLKLTLSYDGTRYQGFTKPKTKEKEFAHTVSAKLTETLNRITGEETNLFCGAKTESGVHALSQIVSFKTDCPLSTEELRRTLNHYLPQDICIFSVEEMSERFHAALNAKTKTYEYRIVNRPVSDVFLRKYALHLAQPLNIFAMEQAISPLTGKKDFQNFSAGKTKKKKSTERELFSIQIIPSFPESISLQTPSEQFCGIPCSPHDIRILLTADDFLYQMPQSIIGTLLDIGTGLRTPDCVERIFTGQETASAPCPAYGLYLKEIIYPE